MFFRSCFSTRKPPPESETSGDASDKSAAATPPPPPKHIEHKQLSAEIQLHVDASSVISIAESAGDAIRKIYDDHEKTPIDVETKDDESPLTLADREANKVICDGLRRLTPHIPIISEENKHDSYEIRKGYQYVWVVDPLDGTKEFIKGNGQFTVNIALVKGSQPVMGVVHTPTIGLTHWAVLGEGAFVRNQGSDHRLNCATFEPGQPKLKIVASASHLNDATKEFCSQFDQPEFMQVGSSLKLLMIAEGLAHIYPRLAPTCEWDTAAAHIIVTESGGQVLAAGRLTSKGELLDDWREVLAKEEPVVYNKEDLLNPSFVVYARRVLPEAAQASADAGEGDGAEAVADSEIRPAGHGVANGSAAAGGE